MTTTTAPATTPTAARCLECGRRLTSARSIALGYGPTCAARIVAAAAVVDLHAYKADQVTRALELIADLAIVRNRSTYAAVASRGDATYDVDPAADTCTCPAGQREVACYHLAAASILHHAHRTRSAAA